MLTLTPPDIFLTKLRKLCIVRQLLNPINHFTCLFMYFIWHYHVLLKMWQWGIPLNALHRATQPPFPRFLVLPPKNTMDKYPSCGFQPKNAFSIHNYTASFYSSYSIFCPVTELAQSIVFLSCYTWYALASIQLQFGQNDAKVTFFCSLLYST